MNLTAARTVNKFERTRFFLFLTMSHSLSRYSICGFSEHTIGVKRIGSLKLMNVLNLLVALNLTALPDWDHFTALCIAAAVEDMREMSPHSHWRDGPPCC